MQSKEILTLEKGNFSLKATLECGQTFRYRRRDDGYEVMSRDKRCFIAERDEKIYLESSDAAYFYNYFDFDGDYETAEARLKEFPELTAAVSETGGIHILRQDLFETIISFIISANNNIPRISGIIERLCDRYGRKEEGYSCFPTPQELSLVTAEDYFALGAGYRDKYLHKTVKTLLESDMLSRLPALGYEDSVRELLKLSGVGRKVADCISLFALHHTCCYPVDVWILKTDGAEGDTVADVRNRGMARYGKYAGLAQQYRYYYARVNNGTNG